MTAIAQVTHARPGGPEHPRGTICQSRHMMSQKQLRLGEIHQQMLASQIFPQVRARSRRRGPRGQAGAAQARQAQVRADPRQDAARYPPRTFNTDPAVVQAAEELDGILDEIEELSSVKQKAAAVANPTEMILEQYRRELDVDREEHAKAAGPDA